MRAENNIRNLRFNILAYFAFYINCQVCISSAAAEIYFRNFLRREDFVIINTLNDYCNILIKICILQDDIKKVSDVSQVKFRLFYYII